MKKGEKKYSDEDIQKIINPYGLILDEYQNVKHLYAHDMNGYKYHFALANITDNKTPHWLMKNPFALDNFRLYLQKNYPNYQLLDDEYHGCKQKMHFLCKKHIFQGVQLNSIDNIVNNHHACKYCGYQELKQKKMLPIDVVKNLCVEKNIEYQGRYLSNHNSYIQYICPKHLNAGIQEMTLDHLRASFVPCRFCQISSGELRVKQFLDKHYIKYNFQHMFDDCKHKRTLEFDFYLPQKNTVIEFDGKQHFQMMKYAKTNEENIRQFQLGQLRDEIKNQYCIQKNIRMLRIPYWEFDNIETILSEKLLKEQSA